MILDTNGLSALAEGEPALECILRKATQAAIRAIVLGAIPIWNFAFSVWESTTNSGSANTCRVFEFSMSTSGTPSTPAQFEQH